MPTTHKGAISFGLVHIPVQLYRTTQEQDIHFNQLCKRTKERVKYKKYCSHCETELKSEDIVKGYQYEKDKYVIMTNEELEELKTEQDRTIHILHFTSLDTIEDIYYEKNLYAIPEAHAQKAYELLRNAMLSEHVVAIAKTVMGTKETLLALCPTKESILVKTLYYDDEISDLPKPIPHPKPIKAELDMAKKLIQSMIQNFDPSQYHDEYQMRLKEAIEDKIAGNKVIKSKHRKDDVTPVDLMEALKQSVASAKSKGKRKNLRH